MNYIDLFAGCGGLSEGFDSAGDFNGVAHVEWELPMVNTLRNRLVDTKGVSKVESKKRVIHFDIQRTDELINGVGESKNSYPDNHQDFILGGLKGIIQDRKIDLVIGGPPCQAYSIAGRAQDKNSMKEDYRNYLFESFARVVKEFSPKIFVFENVQGILSACPGDIPVLKRIHEAFDQIGYRVRKPGDQMKSLLNANDFGVAQNRKRVIIIGVKKDSSLSLDDIYAEIDNQKESYKPTLKDAIGLLPPLYPSVNPTTKESHLQLKGESIEGHSPRYHNSRDVEIFRHWIINEMNSKTLKEKLDFYYSKTGKISNHNKYRNLTWDKPSPTIVSHLQKDGLLFIHPDEKQARSITIREAALIQSFPPNFVFLGSNGHIYKMIGNAVPPLLAKKIAKGLKKFFYE